MAFTEMDYMNIGGGSGFLDTWENPTPSVNFAAQTIPLNTNGASMIIIKQAYATNQLSTTGIGVIDITNGETNVKVSSDSYSNRTYTIVSGGIQVSAPGDGQGNQVAIPLWIKSV